MKKVVLLASVLAAGMAVAPQNANAANPGVNDVQEINLAKQEIVDKIETAKFKRNELQDLYDSFSSVDYASHVPTETQEAVGAALTDIKLLIAEMEKLVEGQESDYFSNEGVVKFGKIYSHWNGSYTDYYVDFLNETEYRSGHYYGGSSMTCNELVAMIISSISDEIDYAKEIKDHMMTKDQIKAAVEKAENTQRTLYNLTEIEYYGNCSDDLKKAISGAYADLGKFVAEMKKISKSESSDFFHGCGIIKEDNIKYRSIGDYYYFSVPGGGTNREKYANSGYFEATKHVTNCADIIDDICDNVAGEISQATDVIYKYLSEHDSHEQIEQFNQMVYDRIVNSDDYKHLDEVFKAASAISDGYDSNYKESGTDAAGEQVTNIYAELTKASFDHELNATIESVENLLERIDDIYNEDNELVSAYDMQTQISTLYPQLEGLLVTYKIEANKIALRNIKEFIAERNIDGEEGIIASLKHHGECHNVAENAEVKARKAALTQYVQKELEVDADWFGKSHDTDSKYDRALNNPAAILMWKDIKNGGKHSDIECLLDDYQDKVYEVALDYDKVDITDKITAVNKKIADLTDKKDIAVTAVEGKTTQEYTKLSALKDYLHMLFNGKDGAFPEVTSEQQSVFKEWTDLFEAIDEVVDRSHQVDGNTNKNYSKDNNPDNAIDPVNNPYHQWLVKDAQGNTTFDVLDTRVTNFFARVDNILSAWDDIVALNADLVELKGNIESYDEQLGHDSDYIKGLWGDNTKGEVKDYNELVAEIEKAIKAIDTTEADAEAAVVAGKWVTKSHFEDEIALEKDHHDWLQTYQKANYDAWVAMKDALDVRFEEMMETRKYTIDSDDPENPDDLGYYTTTDHKGEMIWEIEGEKTPSLWPYDKYGTDHLGYIEIRKHFQYAGSETHDGEHDGLADDLRYNLVDTWYKNGEAEFIGEDSGKVYFADWKKNGQEADHAGKKIDNTVEGLDVATTKEDASAILVIEPATKADVLFGWLQKEIQQNFKNVLENEKANRDIHDTLAATDKYIEDTKTQINNTKVSTIEVDEQLNVKYLVDELKFEVFPQIDYPDELGYRIPYTETLEPVEWSNGITSEGSVTGNNTYNYQLTALNVAEAVEEGALPSLSTVSPEYNPDFNCAYGDELKGWTTLKNVMLDLHDLEKVEFDKVMSVALRDGITKMVKYGESEDQTLAQTIATTKLYSDSIANAACTQLYLNNLAQVYNVLNDAKKWARKLDDKCHEYRYISCSEADIKNNPCGWDNTEAKDALTAIIQNWNEELQTVKDNHDAGINDTEAVRAAFQAYVVEALNDIRNWQKTFAAADMAHKKALLAAYDLAAEEVNTFEATAKIAHHDYVNFSTSDKAAADAWTIAFAQRKLGTFDGQEVTYQEFVQLVLDLEPILAWEDPSSLAPAQKVAKEGLTSFKDYVEATDCLNEYLKAIVKYYYRYHLYTDLKQFGEGLKSLNLDADYMVPVNENRAQALTLNNMVQALLLDIESTKSSVSASGEEQCDDDMMEALYDLYVKVSEVEQDIKDAYFTDEVDENDVYDILYVQTAGSAINIKLHNYANELEAIKTEIANRADRVRTSQHAADNILDKILDVDLWIAEVQVEGNGYENFLVRGKHADETWHVGATSNPDVKYFNEIEALRDALKEEVNHDNSHEGNHSAFDKYNSYVKKLNDIKKEIDRLQAAIEANEAAHELIQTRFEELYADALEAYNFWHTYYTEYSTITSNPGWYIANKSWVEEYNGELEPGESLDWLQSQLHDSYVHGAAAYDWTVDAKGEELNDKANTTFAGYDADLAKDRNDLAHAEALNHYNAVRFKVDYDKDILRGEYDNYDYWTDSWTTNPITADVMGNEMTEGTFLYEISGEYGIYASLNTYLQDIENAYAEGVMEEALNIDEHNTALGIHQQLAGVKATFEEIMKEYTDRFEAAFHLTNGKTIYSDQEYFTIGFFREANDGRNEQGKELFNTVKATFNESYDNIGLYDMTWLETQDVDPDRVPEDAFELSVPVRDEKGYLVHKEGIGLIPYDVQTLTVGYKSNELSFELRNEEISKQEVHTLAVGPVDLTFQAGALNVDGWETRHPVYVEFFVEKPQVEVTDAPVESGSNKLIVRLENPIDLTYTINSLVAKTDDGTEFSYADRVINYAANTIEFDLPEGTSFVELPEGFLTFRTGENSIARSAAKVVVVGGTQTSIDALIAMGDKVQIFDLQGRRMKAESLVKGNTYVVNGVKTMVK